MTNFSKSWLSNDSKKVPEKEKYAQEEYMFRSVITIGFICSLSCDRIECKEEMTTAMAKYTHNLIFYWNDAFLFHVCNTQFRYEIHHQSLGSISIEAHCMALHVN